MTTGMDKNMIEDRADKAMRDRSATYLQPINFEFKNGYVKGATEQKSIDIEKACEWLLKNVSVNINLPDTNCYLKSGWYWEFKKAMEE